MKFENMLSNGNIMGYYLHISYCLHRIPSSISLISNIDSNSSIELMKLIFFAASPLDELIFTVDLIVKHGIDYDYSIFVFSIIDFFQVFIEMRLVQSTLIEFDFNRLK